jgi:hypothetical protein
LNRQSGKLWFIKVFGVFLIGLVIWFILAIWTGTSFAFDFHFTQDLRSNLTANYGNCNFNQSVNYFNLTIMGDRFSDQRLPEESSGLAKKFLLDPIATAIIGGDPELAIRPPTSTPFPVLDSNETTMEKENAPTFLSMIDTSIPAPTNTATETLTNAFSPFSTKIDRSINTHDTITKPSETLISDDVHPFHDFVEYQGGGKWEAYFDGDDLFFDLHSVPNREHIVFTPGTEDRGHRTLLLSDHSRSFHEVLFSAKPEENSGFGWFEGGSSREALEYSNVVSNPALLFTQAVMPQDNRSNIFNRYNLNFQPGSLDHSYDEIDVELFHGEDQSHSDRIEDRMLEQIIENSSSDGYSKISTSVEEENGEAWRLSREYRDSEIVNKEHRLQFPEQGSFNIKIWGSEKDDIFHDGMCFLGSHRMPSECGESAE